MTSSVTDNLNTKAVLGAAQTGKTQYVVDTARALAANGQGRVLVLTGKPAAVPYLMSKLEGLGNVHVSTVPDIALHVMDTPAARERYGREPRLLEPYEEKFLQEDIKTSEMSNKRIKKLTYFLYHGWSNLSDDDPEWIQTGEEKFFINIIRDILTFEGGIIHWELSNFALNTLRNSEQARASEQYDHVIVDDFEQLSRASQHLCVILARTSVLVAGNPSASIECGEENANFDGLQEFVDHFAKAEIIRLNTTQISKNVQAAINNLHQDEVLAAPLYTMPTSCNTSEGDFKDLPGKSMGEELVLIAQLCKAAKQNGESIMIVGTNGVWRKNAVKNLRKAGFDIALAGSKPIKVKNLADEGDCDRAFRDTLAKIIENPKDGVAWRSYLGFGDYVGRSAQLADLRKLCKEHNLGLVEALDLMTRDELPGVDMTKSYYAKLADLYARVITDINNGEAEVETDAAGNGTPQADIVVCDPKTAMNYTADTVVFGGFVNGFIPVNAYFDNTKMVGGQLAREHTDNVRTTVCVARRARTNLYVTGFTSCSLEASERLDIHIYRIKLVDGIRTAVTSMSSMLDLMK